jgi:hypothetical protein
MVPVLVPVDSPLLQVVSEIRSISVHDSWSFPWALLAFEDLETYQYICRGGGSHDLDFFLNSCF